MERDGFKGGSEFVPEYKRSHEPSRAGVEYTFEGSSDKPHERVYTVAVEQKVELERYCFTASYPGKGTVAVETYSDGDIDEIVSGFRGFLLAMGCTVDSINTAFKREW